MAISSYRKDIISNHYTDKHIPGAALEYSLKASGLDREKERAAADADIEALRCSKCEYSENCNYRNLPARLPQGIEGGKGLCLSFYQKRLNGKGFMLPGGEPCYLNSEAKKAIEAALDL